MAAASDVALRAMLSQERGSEGVLDAWLTLSAHKVGAWCSLLIAATKHHRTIPRALWLISTTTFWRNWDSSCSDKRASTCGIELFWGDTRSWTVSQNYYFSTKLSGDYVKVGQRLMVARLDVCGAAARWCCCRCVHSRRLVSEGETTCRQDVFDSFSQSKTAADAAERTQAHKQCNFVCTFQVRTKVIALRFHGHTLKHDLALRTLASRDPAAAAGKRGSALGSVLTRQQ